MTGKDNNAVFNHLLQCDMDSDLVIKRRHHSDSEKADIRGSNEMEKSIALSTSEMWPTSELSEEHTCSS